MATRPLELILARNLLAGLTLAALLCNSDGTIVFLNDAAGQLLGRRFEELGHLTPAQWEDEFGSSAESGVEIGQLVARVARSAAAACAQARLCTADGQLLDAEASAFPLSTIDGFTGAIVLIAATPSPEG